jgi:hypothetical protein
MFFFTHVPFLDVLIEGVGFLQRSEARVERAAISERGDRGQGTADENDTAITLEQQQHVQRT